MSTHPKRAALYLRVSTDEQTIENQREELTALAARAGWRITQTFVDEGISGAKGRDKRPGLDAALNAATRREFDILLVWSVDRLSRSLQDLIVTLSELHAVGCDLFMLRQNVDTTTPAGRAMFQMLGIFAEFERGMIRERVVAGMNRARAQGKHLGRPAIGADTDKAIRRALGEGLGILKVAKMYGVGTGTVHKIKREMTGA